MDGQLDLNTILAALNQIQMDNQTLYQENVELKNIIDQLRGQGGENIHYKEPKVSLPDKFDGSRAQLGLLRSLLTGLALVWFAPLLENRSLLLETFTELVSEFEATFGDADKSRTASNKIRKLTQRSRPASSYASKFRQIAGDLNWGKAALIDQFRNGLRNDV
ncbi:10555_t:CDS:2 [Scutellospora calospora]|uniref:10555_t:CDS:1 n=2 Tax=Scutellospora calospora TaxID=85575 RepID=A0ACA9KVB8_9GLOM|nr:10555_t:CDS:2 [Scutellospora calospora]